MKKKLILTFETCIIILLIIIGVILFIDNKQNIIEEPIKPPVSNKHSEFYIPGVNVEDVILYFNEVVLDGEIINSGDPTKLQKWEVPIYYIINGEYTEEDMLTLTNFTNWLNTIEGFPGIYETKDIGKANLKIYFCDQKRMLELMGNNFKGLDGAVTFWYDNDKIYDAIITYRTDLNQYLRNSVIIEEIYNGLGPIQDTHLRADSIIYSGFSEPQTLTQIDELILKLLYNKEFKPGMNSKECEDAIRKLYY